jgi:hypothetical protein
LRGRWWGRREGIGGATNIHVISRHNLLFSFILPCLLCLILPCLCLRILALSHRVFAQQHSILTLVKAR